MNAVAFSADGKALATSSAEEVKVWDLASGRCTATLTLKFPRHPGAHVLAFSPDGKTLAAYHDPLVLWDLQTHKERAVYPNMRGGSIVLAYDPKGKPLFAGSDLLQSSRRTTLALWDAETGKQVFVRDIPYEAFGPLAFSRDGKVLATGGGPSPVQLWDAATGKNLATFDDRPGRITFLAFNPDGKLLACAFQYLTDDTFEVGVRVYETRTGKVLATLKGKTGPYAPLAFSPDGRILATGDWHGKITLWDLPQSWQDK
jgi:WD40 repeat protein